MYKLNSKFTERNFTVTVVGCGGTGAFVADGLCRLLQDYPARLVLVDFDRVEERNLQRQQFFPEDIGKFKSEVMATRLSRAYRVPVGFTVSPIHLATIFYPGIIVGCVDNGKARKDLKTKISKHNPLDSMYAWRNVKNTLVWWVDAGNGENFGQVLIGNAGLKDMEAIFSPKEEACYLLPYPTIQSPDLLAQAPPAPAMDCVQIAEQEPVINRVMGALTIEVVRRIINGTCSWMQLWLDLQAGTMTPVYATPENVAAISKKKVKSLVRKEV